MAADLVPDGIKIEWNASQNGIPIVNRVYTTVTGGVSESNLDDAYAAALAFFNDIKAAYHPSYVLNDITVTDVSIVGGMQKIYPLVADNIGTSGGSAAAANAAVVISLRSGLVGRSYRGRFYVGGLSNNNLDNAQNIGTSAAAFYASTFEDFMTALNGVGQVLVVVSRFAAGVARIVALTTEVLSLIVDTKIDSQRRRTAN